MLKLGLLFPSTLWMIRDVQPQVQDPHGGIVIRDRRSVRLILAQEPIVVDWISVDERLMINKTTGLGRVFDDTCRRGVLRTLNLVGLHVCALEREKNVGQGGYSLTRYLPSLRGNSRSRQLTVHVIDLIRRLTAMIVCGTIKIVVRVTATCDISGPGRRNAIWKDGWMHDVWEYLSALNHAPA
ncbi:unnamed protein product [Fusarium graminearum]|uniref:Secreted protein n=1 Tax=Gibberella zeae TaxID=5518 RepID=A0A4E9E5P0_GIBZA|nr:unnamed protein product [Fusarium graminearum]